MSKHKQASYYTPNYINKKDEQECLLYVELSVDNIPYKTIKKYIAYYRKYGIEEYRKAKRINRLGSEQSTLVSPSIAIVSKFSG